MRMHALGTVRRVEHEDGTSAGYQMVEAAVREDDLPSREPDCGITARESQMNAGLRGRSRTKGLSEDERMARRSSKGRVMEPEDAIERAMEKVRLWASPASRIDDGRGKPVYGDRAVRCYPKPC